MNVIAALKFDEGFRSLPYVCSAGKLTIGYGVNLNAGISEAEADLLLRHRVQMLEEALSYAVHGYDALSRARKDVLVNMAYNLGLAGLLRFKKMLAAVELGQFSRAADEMLASRWADQVGDRAKRLAAQMRTGTV